MNRLRIAVGTKPALAQEIKDKLSPDLGKPVDSGDMDRQLTEIAGIGRFSRLGYRTVEKNNQEGLLIQADEKQYGPPIVRPLIYIDGSESSNVQFVLGARITFFDVGAFGSEWRNDVAVGSQYGLQSEFFRPFGKSRNWFLAPRAFASDGRAYYYKGSTLLSDYRNREAGGGIDLGYSIDRSSELRLGYEAAHQWLSPTIGLPMFGKLDGRIGVTSVRYNFNERDDPVVPRKGFDLHSRAQWTDAYPGARSGFPLAETQMTLFKPVTERSSVYLGAQGGTTFSYHPTGLPSFSLGGNESLVAYGTNELLTNQYFLFKAGYIHEILELPPIVGDKLYAVGGLEGGKIYGVSQLPMDAFGGVIVKTFLGPVLVGASQGATGHHKVFFRLGRIF